MKIETIDKTTIEGLDNIRSILYRLCAAMLRAQPLEVQMGSDLAQKVWNMPWEQLKPTEKDKFDGFILKTCMNSLFVGIANGIDISIQELTILNEYADKIREQLSRQLGKPDLGFGDIVEVTDEESKMKGQKLNVISCQYEVEKDIWKVYCSSGSIFACFPSTSVTKFIMVEEKFQDKKSIFGSTNNGAE